MQKHNIIIDNKAWSTFNSAMKKIASASGTGSDITICSDVIVMITPEAVLIFSTGTGAAPAAQK